MNLNILLIALLLSPSLLHAQDFAVRQLEASPRHHEWITIPSGDKNIRTFVAHPEKNKNTPAVIVIHENRGLTDWVRSFADQMAAAGYLAIAPDLLSDSDDKHRQTSDYTTSDEARKAIYMLDPVRTTADLRAVQGHVSKMPSSNGKSVVIGFCWGGSKAFQFAADAPGLSAVMVFYGMAPEPIERIQTITAPVYGFYGGADRRVTSTVPKTREAMDKFGKVFKVQVYEGAGHAFMRDGDDPEGSPENKKARDAAWVRIRTILEERQ